MEKNETVIIREAEKSDAGNLIGFVKEIENEKGIDVPLSPGEFKVTEKEEEKMICKYRESDNSLFIVAERQGDILGILNCQGGERKAFVHTAELGMSVKHNFRGAGIGKQLITEAISWAEKNHKIKRLSLNVYARNRRAISLYERFGFKKEGLQKSAIYQEGFYLDNVIMGLLLDSNQ